MWLKEVTEIGTDFHDKEFEIKEVMRFPLNGTLVVLQLIDTRDFEKISKIENLDHAFKVFSPNLKLDFKNGSKEVSSEVIAFKSMKDFAFESWILQSEYLKNLEENANYDELEQQLETIEHQVKELHQNWLTLSLLFDNASVGTSIQLINASFENLSPRQEEILLKTIENELKENFNFSGYKNIDDDYSFLGIPGFINSTRCVDKLAEVCSNYGVILMTDCKDIGSLDEIDEILDLPSSKILMYAHCVINFNRLIDNKKEVQKSIPFSLAILGKCLTKERSLNQPIAGFESQYSVPFNTVKVNCCDRRIGAQLSDKGYCFIIYKSDEIKLMSDRTFFEGEEQILRRIPHVRLLIWIKKSIAYFLHNRDSYFERPQKDRDRIEKRISEFLNSLKRVQLIGMKSSVEINKINEYLSKVSIYVKTDFVANEFVLNFQVEHFEG